MEAVCGRSGKVGCSTQLHHRRIELKADYNLVLPEQGDDLVLTGWVSIQNKTGKVFENAKIKLVAGDVHKEAPDQRGMLTEAFAMSARQSAPKVESEKFDEFHVYRLPLPATLYDGETKTGGVYPQREGGDKAILCL